MEYEFSRTELMFKDEGMQKLNNAHVAVFGVGGVGGYVVEALARCGVGAIDVIDNDVVNITNLNRQIIALHSTVGKYKVDVISDRIKDINPNCKVCAHKTFFTPQTAEQFDFATYDYVVDAIDTVTGKIELVLKAQNANVPIISSMGAGNKLDPTKFEVADIYSTSVCPLARVMRRELKKRGIAKLKVVYSREEPLNYSIGEICEGVICESDNCKQGENCRGDNCKQGENCQGKTCKQGGGKFVKQPPASNAFVPSVAGLVVASEVVKDLINAN